MTTSPTGRRIENITCTEQAFPEFPHLLIGEATDKSINYFDATAYLQKSGLTLYSAEDFFSNYAHPISALVTAYELDKNRVCVQNLEGHLLIDSSLIYLFISYTNPDFLAHINDRIDELLTRGFCVSDAYLYQNAKERLTPEVFLDGDNGTDTD